MTHQRAPRSRLSLLRRGWLVATIATFTGVASHVLAMGHAPGIVLILVCWALSGMLSVLAAALRGSALSTALGVLVTQGVLHFLFAQAGQGVVMAPSGGGSAMMMHQHMSHGSGSMSVTGMAHGDVMSPAMILTHSLAAVLTYVAIRRGDEAVVILRRAVHLGLQWLAPLPPRRVEIARAPRPLLCGAPLRVRIQSFFPGPTSPRGPPALSAFA